MSRLPRDLCAEQDIHTIFRSVDNSFIFSATSAQELMLWVLRRMRFKHRSQIYAWVGMSNHQHIFNQSPNDFSEQSPPTLPVPYRLVGNMFRDCFSIFAKKLNRIGKRVGGVIRDRTKTVKVYDSYQSMTLLIYIFLNPVRAGIVRHPREYPFSNYSMYAYGIHKHVHKGIFSYHPAYLALGKTDALRRSRFCYLVEKALREWGLRKFAGISGSHGVGRNRNQNFYNDFVRFSAAWIPQRFGLGPSPPLLKLVL